MTTFTVKMVLEKETKGALRYMEVDENGAAVEQVWAKLGTSYIRKTAFERGTARPKAITITVAEDTQSPHVAV
jgi:hypothetical protein